MVLLFLYVTSVEKILFNSLACTVPLNKSSSAGRIDSNLLYLVLNIFTFM